MVASAHFSTPPGPSIPAPVYETGLPVELQKASRTDEQTEAMTLEKSGEFVPRVRLSTWT
jgi:hypothetical protein